MGAGIDYDNRDYGFKWKQAVARRVLEALTDWFVVEESREEYISGCVNWTFFAAKEENEWYDWFWS